MKRIYYIRGDKERAQEVRDLIFDRLDFRWVAMANDDSVGHSRSVDEASFNPAAIFYTLDGTLHAATEHSHMGKFVIEYGKEIKLPKKKKS